MAKNRRNENLAPKVKIFLNKNARNNKKERNLIAFDL